MPGNSCLREGRQTQGAKTLGVCTGRVKDMESYLRRQRTRPLPLYFRSQRLTAPVGNPVPLLSSGLAREAWHRYVAAL